MDTSETSNLPLLIRVDNEDQIPEGIKHLHRVASHGYAGSYLPTKTGGMIVKFLGADLLPCDFTDFPELAGIESFWLCYSGARTGVKPPTVVL